MLDVGVVHLAGEGAGAGAKREMRYGGEAP